MNCISWTPFNKEIEQCDSKSKLELAKSYFQENSFYYTQSAKELLNSVINEGEIEGYYWLGLYEKENGLPHFQTGAEKGDPQCQHHLASLYHAKGDLVQAIKWLKLSAAADHLPSHELLAEIDLSNRQNCFQIWYDLKDKNAFNEYRLGLCYQKGLGTPPDANQAILHIKNAALKKNPAACYYLGKCYLLGDMVPKDPFLALENLMSAAKMQHQGAKWELANLWLKGEEGIEKNVFEAQQLLDELIESKDPVYTPLALDLLGCNHLRKRQNDEAGRCFTQAVWEYGLPKAFFHLGILHYSFNKITDAGDCFKRAKILGIAEADFFIGKFYLKGNCIEQATDIFQKSAQKGVSGSYYELGKLLLKSNEKKAVAYLIKAFKMDYNPFYYKFAGIFLRFSTESHELQEDIKACNIAAKNKVPEAMIALASHYSIQKIWNLAFGYYEKAAQLGNVLAQERVGNFYLLGIGVKGDENLALEYLKKASDNGDIIASETLGSYYQQNGNTTLAIQYYQQSNSDFAQYKLSELNDSHLQALKSARSGYIPAMVLLGNRLMEGFGEQAKMWFERAAALGNIESLKRLAIGYYQGDFGEKDLDQSISCFLKLSDSSIIDHEILSVGFKAKKEREKRFTELFAQIRLQNGRLFGVLNQKKNEYSHRIVELDDKLGDDHSPTVVSRINQNFVQQIESEAVEYQQAICSSLNFNNATIKDLEKIRLRIIKYVDQFTSYCDFIGEQSLKDLEIAHRIQLEEANAKLRERVMEAVEGAFEGLKEREKPIERAKKKICHLQQDSYTHLNLAKTIHEMEKIVQDVQLEIGEVVLSLDESPKEIKKMERDHLKKIQELEREIDRERKRHALEIEALKAAQPSSPKPALQIREEHYERTGYLADYEKCLTLISALKGSKFEFKQLEEGLRTKTWETYDALGSLLEHAGFNWSQNGTRHRVYRCPLNEKIMISLPYQKAETALPTYRSQVLRVLIDALNLSLQL